MSEGGPSRFRVEQGKNNNIEVIKKQFKELGFSLWQLLCYYTVDEKYVIKRGQTFPEMPRVSSKYCDITPEQPKAYL